MEYIRWSKELSVGVKALDADHKTLIAIINQLCDEVARGNQDVALGEIFSRLMTFTETHFGREEALMLSIDYPDLEAHCRQHRGFVRHLEDLHGRHRDGDLFAALELFDFLNKWLIAHIIECDFGYRPYLEEPEEPSQVPEPESALNAFLVEDGAPSWV
ncbi:MAG: bacteriohemerythrin [Azospirillum sp.]|nr:bacteriohemerythrin [Azospirillum sp.]